LARLHVSLGDLFPIRPERLGELDEERLNAVDAFCKRFEQLAIMLGEIVFRPLAVIGQEDTEPRSRRDLRALMARYGVLDDPEAFAEVLDARHRLAHVYPFDAERQAAILNEAYELTPLLLDIFDRTLAFVGHQGWVDTTGLQPVGYGTPRP
jgi:hypothetical protein